MKYPEGSIENFLDIGKEDYMGKRWKKDKVKCEVCKEMVLRKDTKEYSGRTICKKHHTPEK